jgi:hypothetical protein
VKQEEGVVHQLWGITRALEGEGEGDDNPPAADEEGEGEGEEEEEEEKMPPHLLIEDVTREP